ncbi:MULTISPECIES: amidohydrolase family protein [unclassified Frankia]|uniref:amidohydrolase family protein n=1 Tax=unclassified Frankia TaxID=2632575 RepID=UPI001EF4EC1C|nr:MULTISPECIES: amidohydrolase family protein [unclassified Frankia]
MAGLDFGLFDCDTHCYETRDAFTRYLPAEWSEHAVRPIRFEGGVEKIMAADRVATFNSEQGLGFDLAYRPGSLKEMLRQMASGNPDETYEPEPMRPEYLDRDVRLKLMDAQGVDRAVVFPSAMALSVENYVKNVPAAYANVHAFNRWFEENWGFAYKDRIYGPALLSLRDLDLAVAELDDVLARGARVVLLPTGPVNGRSPGDPYFDPIWARLNEAGVTVAFHIMENWYNEHIAPAWGYDAFPAAWHMSAWQWNNLYGERPIEDTLSALIYDNIFGRFPNLMVLVAEFGASWVPHFIEHMDKSRGMGRNGPWIGGRLTERPSAIFQRHIRVAPYPEDNIAKIVRDLPDVDCLVMGSDFPHAEGLADPADFAQLVTSLTPEQQRKILRGNAEKLFEKA